MEPERLDLPAEVLDLAVGHPRQPVGHQAALHLVEFAHELIGVVVPAGDRAALLGQVRPRPA